jgi:SNF2 family DNA or RNA helicase
LNALSKIDTFADYCTAAGLSALPAWADTVRMGRTPFNHQIGDLNHLAQHTRSGLWSSPGVGKTLPAQGYGLWLTGSGNKVVYLMPPILVPQFLQSLASNYPGIDQHVVAASLQGAPKQREKLIASWGERWPDLLMLSYRMFVQYHMLLKANGYTCVVVDEATCLKTSSSKIHAAVKVFAGKHGPESNGVVLMTGSPVDTNISDAYGLIAILNPNRYGSRRAFDRAHCIYASELGQSYNRDTIVAYKNHNYLHHSLFLSGRRVLKSEVSDLPPRLITEYPIDLHPRHKALYKKLVDERMVELGDQLIDMTTQSALYQAMQRVLLSPERYTDEKIDNEIFNLLDSLLDSLEGHKVVVYAWFQASIEAIMARYARLNPVSIYGKTTPAQRESNKHKFINDPDCKLWVSNPKSGGVGVDGLQHVSSHTIFAEVCPFPGTTQQAIDRQHRTGQHADSVNVYILVPTGTVAVKLRNDLLRKDAQQELVVCDKRTILHDLLGEGGIQGSLDKLNYLDAIDTRP